MAADGMVDRREYTNVSHCEKVTVGHKDFSWHIKQQVVLCLFLKHVRNDDDDDDEACGGRAQRESPTGI
jgi:hypothetical protein